MRRWSPLLVAFVVSLAGLRVGFTLDDWPQRGVVRGALNYTTKFDLFTFGSSPETTRVMMDWGFPWFTWGEFKLRFFRPLSSALIVLDTELFGDAAWPQHLHSTLWYLLLTALVLTLYRRVAAPVATLAGLLFALDDAHTFPVTWLANRNAIVAASFVTAGLLAHLAWREAGKRWGAPLSLLLFALGLCAGESAVSTMAFVPAFEWFHARGSARARLASLAQGLWPVTGLLAAYTALYKRGGYGASAVATYLDPATEPVAFLTAAPGRFLANVGAQSFGLPDLWLVLPAARGAMIASGVVALGCFVLAWRRWAPRDEAARRTLGWLLLGSLGAMLPGLGTFPSTRLFTPASVGLAVVVATLLTGAWNDRGLRRWLGVGWLAGAFVLQPLGSWVTMPWSLAVVAERLEHAMRTLALVPGERVVVISSTDFGPPVYGAAVNVELGLPLPAQWRVWSMAPLPVVVSRPSERVVELEVVGGRMIDTVFEENFRSERFPMRVGEEIALEGERYTVLAVDAGKPTRVRIELARDPETLTFVWWNGDTLERVRLPEVGASRRFPRPQQILERLLLGEHEPT